MADYGQRGVDLAGHDAFEFAARARENSCRALCRKRNYNWPQDSAAASVVPITYISQIVVLASMNCRVGQRGKSL